MRYTVTDAGLATGKGDVAVMPIFQEGEAADFGPLRNALGDGAALARQAAAAGFEAKAEQLLPVWSDEAKAGWILLAGAGPVDKAGLESLRRMAGRAASRAREMRADRMLIVLPRNGVVPFDDTTVARCWAEGGDLALSLDDDCRTGKNNAPPPPRSCLLLAERSRHAAVRRGLKEAEAFVAGCLFARRLGNLPGNLLTPKSLAQRARAMARREGLRCEVLGPPRLRRLRMGGLLAVGQGSAQPPQLITLDYRPTGRRAAAMPHVALVGKGVTFDSGGISLKPAAGMDEMKMDMCGAAAVLGAALIAARLALPVRLTVVVPTAENMPDGLAVKPADVITMADGQTVEVLNTDAEGRLILADALWYAARSKPDHIIDAATLTGACVVALGEHFAGLMGNSAELIDVLRQAGGETFERVWHLPVVEEHRDEVRGACGDLKNMGNTRYGGALAAGAFLSHFVDEATSWAHIDMAGTAWVTKPRATCPRGATGFGARLLARALQILVG